MFRHFPTAAGIMLAMQPIAASAQETRNPVSTGFRVEGLVGYDDAGLDSVSRGDGLLYGVGVGYDAGWRRFRFGVDAEVTESTARDCFALNGVPGEACLRASRDLYVGARLGIEIDPGVLLYGKAGYSNFAESNMIPSLGIATFPRFDGFRVGLGVEYAVGPRSFVKAEYRYSNYERSQDFNRNQAVIGFGFRF